MLLYISMSNRSMSTFVYNHKLSHQSDHFPILPLAIVLVVVRKVEGAFAMHVAIFPLAIVLLVALRIELGAFAMSFVIFPLAIVLFAVRPVEGALAIVLAIFQLSFVFCAIVIDFYDIFLHL